MKKSLEEVHSTVYTTHLKFSRRLFAFLGPAFLVSVGYMDPGNWATDIAGGSKFGYTLIWVLLMSNIMAVILQSHCARLGIVRGLDLAQASKETYPKTVNISLYILAELAIAATDLAEVLGMAIGLNLLFNIPLLIGVLVTFFDTFLLLFLINKGIRKMEAFIISLIFIIGICFLVNLIFAKPQFGEVVQGFVPSIPNHTALYIAIGIIGATVMPHNLYLHSALVQTRIYGSDNESKRQAIKYNFIDSAVALNLAFFVNAAILILAASTFFKSGMFEVSEIQDAHKFLEPLLGNNIAPVLFALALIASGQSSTLTGTLSGQIVMEGYINFRMQPWARRMVTRTLAIVPAVIVIINFGEQSVGDLMVLSQVCLSLQLGFAVIPLIHFVSDKAKMGKFAINIPLKIISWAIALVIVYLNSQLVLETITNLISTTVQPGLIWLTVVPITILVGILLIFITVQPAFRFRVKLVHTPHKISPYELEVQMPYKRIAIAIDLSQIDNKVINTAISMGQKEADYLLVHIAESAGARLWGSESSDQEAQQDPEELKIITEKLQSQGYNIRSSVGFGNPKKLIPKIVQEFDADLVVLGSHGHKALKDIVFGTVLDEIRHKLKIPMFIVKE